LKDESKYRFPVRCVTHITSFIKVITNSVANLGVRLEVFCVSSLFVKPPAEVISFVKPKSIQALSQLGGGNSVVTVVHRVTTRGFPYTYSVIV